jgi:3-dehydroquinate synthetase
VIKHGLLADPGLLAQIDRLGHPPRLRDGDLATWQALVLRAIRVKRDVVEEDPFESGRRAILNLGHTFAHAIERVSSYTVSHGEAVAIGLVAAADLSVRLGHAEGALLDEVRSRLAGVGLPRALPHPYSAGELYAAMGSDKKKKGGRLRFILLRGVGQPFVTADVSAEAVLATLKTIGASHE